MSMAANKIKGIRAALCGDCFSAQMTKEHNNANVLCLGARVIDLNLHSELQIHLLIQSFLMMNVISEE